MEFPFCEVITSWQVVGSEAPGIPLHIPSQPTIGQNDFVLSTATSTTKKENGKKRPHVFAY